MVIQVLELEPQWDEKSEEPQVDEAEGMLAGTLREKEGSGCSTQHGWLSLVSRNQSWLLSACSPWGIGASGTGGPGILSVRPAGCYDRGKRQRAKHKPALRAFARHCGSKQLLRLSKAMTFLRERQQIFVTVNTVYYNLPFSSQIFGSSSL